MWYVTKLRKCFKDGLEETNMYGSFSFTNQVKRERERNRNGVSLMLSMVCLGMVERVE
jgi:hypothetical protein